MNSPRTLVPSLGAALLAASSLSSLSAQTVITSLETKPLYTLGAPTVVGGRTFANQVLEVNQFTAGSVTYQVNGQANAVFVRRNSTSPNQSSVWYARNPSGGFRASYATDYGSLLLGNNLLRGSDNTFANSDSLNAARGNIERLDFTFSGGVQANTSMGFAVFDRGLADVHDGFGIALITGWDFTTNLPTSYSSLVRQAPNWTPAINARESFNYTLFRYNTGDSLQTPTAASDTASQGIGGMVFNIGAFGVAEGTSIYGYSLFGYDMPANTNSAQLLDWTNSTIYPTNTTGLTGAGGIDLAAVNGMMFSVIPEPSTYALGGVALAVLGAALRRRPRAPLSPAV